MQAITTIKFDDTGKCIIKNGRKHFAKVYDLNMRKAVDIFYIKTNGEKVFMYTIATKRTVKQAITEYKIKLCIDDSLRVKDEQYVKETINFKNIFGTLKK